MRSITTLDLQYAHRFYGFKGEAQYLHGHTGVLTIEVEDTVEPGVNMVFPCNEIQKTAWSVLKNFDHALILREDDPLLPAILDMHEALDNPVLVHPEEDWYPPCPVGGDNKRNLVASDTNASGDIDQVLASCDIVLDRTYHTKAFNQAMMEFGALQCVPRSPDCGCCPLADMCRALAEKRVDSLPVKAGKTVVKPRYFNYLDIRHGNTLLLKKRSGQDIWQNLYEFPLIETDRPFSWEELQETADFRALFDGIREVRFLRVREFKKHVLSHRVIYPVFYRLEVSEYSSGMAAYLQVSDDSLETYAVSRLMQAYLEKEL